MADLNEAYGQRFDRLLPQVIRDIEREIDRINGPILSGELADEEKIAHLLENEAELKQFVSGRFDESYRESIDGAYADAIDQAATILEAEGITFTLRDDQLSLISTLKRSDLLLLSVKSTESADAVFDSMVRWAYSGSSETLQPLRIAIDELGAARHASTIINTQVSKFFRQINVTASQNAGVKKFRYGGPAPEREFCVNVMNGNRAALGISHIRPAGKGRVYTTEEINAMNNGQLPNVTANAGGFNCRHFWIPVAD